MPATQRHPASRPLITGAIILVVVGFLSILFFSSAKRAPKPAIPPAPAAPSTNQPSTPPGDATPPTAGPLAGADAADQTPPTETPAGDDADDAQLPTTAFDALRVRPVDPATAPEPTPIGSLDPDDPKQALIEFTLAGAGVKAVTMADFYETIEDATKARANPAQAEGHYRLQREISIQGYALISLAARRVIINGTPVDLYAAGDQWAWRETAPGAFIAEIVDGPPGNETPIARITRAYTLADGSLDITVAQSVENLTDAPLDIRWIQYGPVDLNEDPSGFRIPSRRIRFGYLLDPRRDPGRQIVRADDRLLAHDSFLDDIAKAGNAPMLVWPDAEEYPQAFSDVWLAQTSRYFGFIVHPLIPRDRAQLNIDDPQANPIDKHLELVEQVWAIPLGVGDDAHLILELHSPPIQIAPGAAADLSFGAYAGPMSRRILSKRTSPVFETLNLADIVIYQIGWCGWCTFQPIARLLIAILHFFHDYLVHDWALAIILLVLCVRGALHPIFKKSQVSMLRFSKQMQRIQPKIKKIQEKYKGDPQKLREEQMRLMKEERVNYAGALGCLPMFLQTPIWIALYASLYFAFELRHEPAFFGLFQAISGNHWYFLADLSRPDNFIPLGVSFDVPLLGTVTGINIFPLLWGFVFFIHQKYLTPPTSANMTPEQEQTQKMVKVMMVVMMPVFMYNAPSGLLVYFLTNSVLAIAEGRYIRAHVDKLELEKPADKPHTLGRKKVSSTAKPASPFGKKPRDEGKSRFKKR